MNVVKECRKRLGLSQGDFANLIGVHSVSISKWETGAAKAPAGAHERICRLILKGNSFPRAGQLKDWIRQEGGQAALNRLIKGGQSGTFKASPAATGAEGIEGDEDLEELAGL